MSTAWAATPTLEGLTITLCSTAKAVLGPLIGFYPDPDLVFPNEGYYCNVITPEKEGVIETSRKVYQETQGKYNNIVITCYARRHPEEHLSDQSPKFEKQEGNPTSYPGREHMPIAYVLKYSGINGVALILYDMSRLTSDERCCLAKKSNNSDTRFYANLFESLDAEKRAYYSNPGNFCRKYSQDAVGRP